MDASAVAIDTKAAEAYDQYLVPPVFGPWAQFVVDLAQVRDDEHVLDLACGTGAVTTCAAKRAARVIGIDTDAAMIEIARRNSGYCDHIEWRHGDACRLDFEPAMFDVCLCVQGLQHFVDRHSALRHVLRVLKPTGRFIAAVWAGVENTPGLFAVLQELEACGIDPSSFRRPFALGDRGELQTLVTSAGFNEIDLRTHDKAARFASVEAFLLALRAGSAASRDALNQAGSRGWRAFATRVQRRLTPFIGSNGLVFPYQAHVVLARP